MGKKRKECPRKEESLVQKQDRVGAGRAAQLAEYLPGVDKSLDLIPSTE